MSKNIEFDRIKSAILNGEKSEEYEAWRNQDKKNIEMESRVRRYYEEGLSFDTNDQEIEACWKKFETTNFRRRRVLLKLSAAVASVAAVVAILFFTFDLTAEKESVGVKLTANKEVNDEKLDRMALNGDIVLKTADGDQRVINEEKIDFTKLRAANTTNTSDSTEYQTIIVPKGKSFKVVLADGTTVHLNNHTEFSYPVSFDATKERKVFLSGEAFFEVSKDAKRRFIVSMDGIDVRVYGTKFNVNTNKAGVIETVLVEGSVSAQPTGASEVMIQPNQRLTYTLATANVQCDNVDVTNYVSWMSGIYRFNRQNLRDIMSALSLWYDIEVVYDDAIVANQEYICNIPRYQSFDDVLDILQKYGNIGCEMSGRKLHLWAIR